MALFTKTLGETFPLLLWRRGGHCKQISVIHTSAASRFKPVLYKTSCSMIKNILALAPQVTTRTV